MDDFIEAIEIFKQYIDKDDFGWKHPFHCEHDTLYMPHVTEDQLTEDELEKLDDLGFFPSSKFKGFKSFRFGSC